MITTPYGAGFYNEQAAGSALSASVVVPLVLPLVQPLSVVDIGCGIGTWAAEFLAAGVPIVEGMDGDYVERGMLRIPETSFKSVDLTKPLECSRRYDLAVCLEVAEHLPESRAEGLVADLVRLAPAVLFSAAIPGQGGTEHINEQHLFYWNEKFRIHDYVALDAVRPKILGDPRVEWWYQQNIVLFVASQQPISKVGIPRAGGYVHPFLYDQHRLQSDQRLRFANAPPLRHVIQTFAPAVRRAITKRLFGLRESLEGRS